MRLLFRETLKHDECLLSYLIRVSEFNGFKNLGYLLKYAGLDWKNNRAPIHEILSGQFDLTPYFEELGLHPFKSPIERVVHSFRKATDAHQILVSLPKVCPKCLSEKGYAKANWAFLPVICCTEHKLMLIDTDNSTNTRLSWYRQRLDRFNPSNKTSIEKEVLASKDILKHTSFIESLIENRTVIGSIPAVLSNLDFREILSLMHFLMHFQCRLNAQKFTPNLDSNLEIAQKYRELWIMLNNWPDSFYSMLSQYVETPMSNKGKTGLNKHFRDFYEKLNRQKENRGIQRIRVEFERYVQNYWPGVIETDRVTRLNLDKNIRDVISKKEASRMLSCRGPKIDNYVQNGNLVITIFNGKAHYSRKEVMILSERISSNWSMEQLSEALEVTRYQAKQALDEGLFPVIQAPDSNNRDWLIDKEKSQEIIKNLVENGVEAGNSDIKVYTRERFQRLGYSFSSLLNAMINKEIFYSVEKNPAKPYSVKQFSKFWKNTGRESQV